MTFIQTYPDESDDTFRRMMQDLLTGSVVGVLYSRARFHERAARSPERHPEARQDCDDQHERRRVDHEHPHAG